jgi:hypothetical protein
MKRHGFAALALTLALGLVACGGTEDIKKADIEKEAQAQFDKIAQDQGAESFPKITCPEDLKPEKGATTTCSATSDEGTLDITVTVSEIKDGKARLNFKGADEFR